MLRTAPTASDLAALHAAWDGGALDAGQDHTAPTPADPARDAQRRGREHRVLVVRTAVGADVLFRPRTLVDAHYSRQCDALPRTDALHRHAPPPRWAAQLAVGAGLRDEPLDAWWVGDAQAADAGRAGLSVRALLKARADGKWEWRPFAHFRNAEVLDVCVYAYRNYARFEQRAALPARALAAAAQLRSELQIAPHWDAPTRAAVRRALELLAPLFAEVDDPRMNAGLKRAGVALRHFHAAFLGAADTDS
jgi:hypothetical protein